MCFSSPLCLPTALHVFDGVAEFFQAMEHLLLARLDVLHAPGQRGATKDADHEDVGAEQLDFLLGQVTSSSRAENDVGVKGTSKRDVTAAAGSALRRGGGRHSGPFARCDEDVREV